MGNSSCKSCSDCVCREKQNEYDDARPGIGGMPSKPDNSVKFQNFASDGSFSPKSPFE